VKSTFVSNFQSYDLVAKVRAAIE